MDVHKLRAWWWHKQGIDGSLSGKIAAEVLERSGWARGVGGVGPYLTLFSRGGISREDADAAVANLDIYELPAARGCTYVVPASDFALALKVGESFAGAEMKVAAKLGVTEREIDKLCDAVVAAVGKKPLSPEEIREKVGSAARSLGEEGKKKGLTTTLPVALGRLQAHGEIRRVPNNGRLDQQRYGYVRWQPNPLAKFKLSLEQASTELARRYFGWIGPARLAEFQAFAAAGAKVVKAAVEPLKLEAVERGSDLLILPEDRDAFESTKPSKQPQYALVSSLDGISLFRRDNKFLIDEGDIVQQRLINSGLMDLPNHAILDRGRVVGLWEYDTETNSIAWTAFVPKTEALKKAVMSTEAYVREQLGDARSFSLDSPKSRVGRIEALRAAG